MIWFTFNRKWLLSHFKLSYYWRSRLSNPDGSDNFSSLTESTPFYTYPNGQMTANPEAFNCHFHAFGTEYATETYSEHPKWVTKIKIDSKVWESVTGSVKVGDRVMYFINNNGVVGWTHSAIVTEVDANGFATKVSSKLGTYQIIEHHPRDIRSLMALQIPPL